jgi:hypothetical protein
VSGRSRRAAALAAAVPLALLAAGCGGEAGDLLLVQRTGTIPGARLDLRITFDGRASCDRGPLRSLTSAQTIEARDLERRLTGEDDEQGPARRGVVLPPGPGSIMRYRVRMEAGSVAFSDTSPGQPQEFFRIAKLTRDVAQDVCGRPR